MNMTNLALKNDQLWQAVVAKDARFDGQFGRLGRRDDAQRRQRGTQRTFAGQERFTQKV